MARSAAIALAAAASATLLLDQLSKALILGPLDLAERLRIEVVPGVFTLQMAWNRGVNFGLFAQDGRAAALLLAGLAAAVSVAVAIWAMRRGDRFFALGAGLLVGGALGNAIDRLRFGAVADFLNVTCCGIRNPWAFNVADVAIFAGALALAFAPSHKGANDAARTHGERGR